MGAVEVIISSRFHDKPRGQPDVLHAQHATTPISSMRILLQGLPETKEMQRLSDEELVQRLSFHPFGEILSKHPLPIVAATIAEGMKKSGRGLEEVDNSFLQRILSKTRPYCPGLEIEPTSSSDMELFAHASRQRDAGERSSQLLSDVLQSSFKLNTVTRTVSVASPKEDSNLISPQSSLRSQKIMLKKSRGTIPRFPTPPPTPPARSESSDLKHIDRPKAPAKPLPSLDRMGTGRSNASRMVYVNVQSSRSRADDCMARERSNASVGSTKSENRIKEISSNSSLDRSSSSLFSDSPPSVWTPAEVSAWITHSLGQKYAPLAETIVEYSISGTSMYDVLTDKESLSELGVTSKVMQLVVTKEVTKLFSKRFVKVASMEKLEMSRSGTYPLEGSQSRTSTGGADVDMVIGAIPGDLTLDLGMAEYSEFGYLHDDEEGGEDADSFRSRMEANSNKFFGGSEMSKPRSTSPGVSLSPPSTQQIKKPLKSLGKTLSNVEIKKLLTLSEDEVEIIREIGQGSYGTVYLGSYGFSKVAVKETRNINDNDLDDLLHEIYLLTNLVHPNILRVFGYVPSKNWIVTEYFDGGSVSKVLQRIREGKAEPLSLKAKYYILCQASSAVFHLHKQGVIHRDLACRNLLINKGRRRIVLCDFGMSRVKSDHNNTVSTIGAVRWMAPESITDLEYSERSDAWSFGCLICEIMTELYPYPRIREFDVVIGLNSFNDTNFRPEIRQDWSEELQVLLHALFSRKDERPAFDEISNILTEIYQMEAGPESP